MIGRLRQGDKVRSTTHVVADRETLKSPDWELSIYGDLRLADDSQSCAEVTIEVEERTHSLKEVLMMLVVMVLIVGVIFVFLIAIKLLVMYSAVNDD